MNSALSRAAAAVLAGLLALLLAATVVPAQPDAARGAEPAARKAKKMKLELLGASGVVNGSAVTFAGTVAKKAKGKSAVLLRSVNGGPWVAAGKAKVGPSGTFQVSGVAVESGSNQWRTTVRTKKRKYASNVVKTDVYAWFPMTEDNAVDNGFYEGPTNIGSQVYSRGLSASLYSPSSSLRYGEWNLSYKCTYVSFAYGMDNDSASGSVARFSYALDGAASPIADKGLGEPTALLIATSGRLRIRLNAVLVAGGNYGYPTYAEPQALCLSNPF